MGWLTENEEGMRMKKTIKGILMFFACCIFIGSTLMIWVHFSPQIKNAIQGDTLAGCDYVLPSLPGVYCQGRDSGGNMFYYDSKIKVFIK